MARQYLGRPELSASKFIPRDAAMGPPHGDGGALPPIAAFAGVAGGGLLPPAPSELVYRTGDLGIWHQPPPGEAGASQDWLEICGRRDAQLKVRDGCEVPGGYTNFLS